MSQHRPEEIQVFFLLVNNLSDERSESYYTARNAIEDMFPEFGHDCESVHTDENGDDWDALVVMRCYYIRLKDGKLSLKSPD